MEDVKRQPIYANDFNLGLLLFYFNRENEIRVDVFEFLISLGYITKNHIAELSKTGSDYAEDLIACLSFQDLDYFQTKFIAKDDLKTKPKVPNLDFIPPKRAKEDTPKIKYSDLK